MWPMDPSNPGAELPHPASYYATEYNDGYSFESTNTSTSVPGAADQWPGVVAQANNGQISYQGITFYSDAVWDLPFAGLFDIRRRRLAEPGRAGSNLFGHRNHQVVCLFEQRPQALNTTRIVLTNVGKSRPL